MRYGGLFLALGFAALATAGAQAADSAVVLLYHRFGEPDHPASSVRLDQFEAQIDELKGGGYAVLPVPEIVQAIAKGRPLPERAVGLTVDDAYRSILTEAWPPLRAAGFPLTVFVATGPVDAGFPDYLTWDELRQLVHDGVTIGAHTVSHAHMVEASASAIDAEIAQANARIADELGLVPELFAYPYGEMSLAVRARAKAAGYRFAFGQHSGVVFPGADVFNLPRFAINERYGNLPEFRLRARALPLPVRDFSPADPLIGGANPPEIGFTVDPEVGGIEQLACYAAGGPVVLKREAGSRIEVRLAAALPPGHSRLSCTLPGGEGRWRWFGAAFHVPVK